MRRRGSHIAVRRRLREMMEPLPRGPVIVTKHGRPCAALASLDAGVNLEAFLVAHNPGLLALIERGMAQAGGIPLREVEREISRRERKQRARR